MYKGRQVNQNSYQSEQLQLPTEGHSLNVYIS